MQSSANRWRLTQTTKNSHCYKWRRTVYAFRVHYLLTHTIPFSMKQPRSVLLRLLSSPRMLLRKREAYIPSSTKWLSSKLTLRICWKKNTKWSARVLASSKNSTRSSVLTPLRSWQREWICRTRRTHLILILAYKVH